MPENLVPLVKEVVSQLEHKLPENMLEEVATTLLREIQYQQLRENSYQRSQESLKKILDSLSPLPKLAADQSDLNQTMGKLVVTQDINNKQNYQLVEEIETFRDSLQNIDTSYEKLCHELTQQVESIKDLGSLHEQLRGHLSQSIQTVEQGLAKNSGGLGKLQKELNEDTELLKNIKGGLSKLEHVMEAMATRVREDITLLNDGIANFQSSSGNMQLLETLFKTNLSSIDTKITAVDQQLKDTASQNAQDINQMKNLLASFHKQMETTSQQQATNLLTIGTEFSAKWQKLESQSSQEELQKKLIQLEEMMKNVVTLAHHLHPLQHLPDQLNIPDNFAAIVESIPTNTKNIKGYLEHFRHDLATVSQHSLELLQANREQGAEFAKFQTSVVPEIQALQHAWQKLSLRIDEHMSELASAITKIKSTVGSLALDQQQEEQLRFRSQHSAELPDIITRAKESLSHDISNQLSDVTRSLKLQLHDEFAGLLSQFITDMKNQFHQELTGMIEAQQHKFQSIDDQLYEMNKAVNRIDIKLLAREGTPAPGAEKKVTSYCPHCSKEVTAPLSFQGKRVLCPACNERFTFPTIHQ